MFWLFIYAAKYIFSETTIVNSIRIGWYVLNKLELVNLLSMCAGLTFKSYPCDVTFKPDHQQKALKPANGNISNPHVVTVAEITLCSDLTGMMELLLYERITLNHENLSYSGFLKR